MRITSHRLNLEDTLLNGQQGYFEGSTTEIEGEDIAFSYDFFIKTVGDSSCHRLVDDTEDIEASDRSGVFGGLPLTFIEVSRYCDNGVHDRRAQV